jgi:hypothetical protein
MNKIYILKILILYIQLIYGYNNHSNNTKLNKKYIGITILKTNANL